jgi:hypothetical protein
VVTSSANTGVQGSRWCLRLLILSPDGLCRGRILFFRIDVCPLLLLWRYTTSLLLHLLSYGLVECDPGYPTSSCRFRGALSGTLKHSDAGRISISGICDLQIYLLCINGLVLLAFLIGVLRFLRTSCNSLLIYYILFLFLLRVRVDKKQLALPVNLIYDIGHEADQ